MIGLPVGSVTAYRWVLALNFFVVLGLLAYKIIGSTPVNQYSHRLVTYEFGFIRRALVGEIYGWLFERVPIWAVSLDGVLALVVAAAVGAVLFRKSFNTLPRLERAALAAFLVGSPFLFKNFVQTLGYFDVYGATVVMVVMLAPYGVWTVIAATAAGALLLLVHHIHATLFLPTLFAVLLVKAYARNRMLRVADLALLGTAVALLVALFLAILVFGTPQVGADAFMAHLRARATSPVGETQYTMWYSTLAEEMAATWVMLPRSLARLPVYVLLILAHLPLLVAARAQIARMRQKDSFGFLLYIGLLVMVAIGYLATFLTAYDHARFVSCLAVCFVLLTIAALTELGGPLRDAEALAAESRRTLAFAIALAFIPRVGTVFPF